MLSNPFIQRSFSLCGENNNYELESKLMHNLSWV